MSERADASWSNQELSHYLVCVVEAEASHAASASQESPSQAAQADAHIGVVAVEISTGDVLYGQFRYTQHVVCKQQNLQHDESCKLCGLSQVTNTLLKPTRV